MNFCRVCEVYLVYILHLWEIRNTFCDVYVLAAHLISTGAKFAQIYKVLQLKYASSGEVRITSWNFTLLTQKSSFFSIEVTDENHKFHSFVFQVFQTFSGNFGLGHFIFHDGILGKGFKIIPLSWTTNIAVNWKFLGCPNPGKSYYILIVTFEKNSSDFF